MALTPEEIQKLQEQFNKLNEELSKLGGTAFKTMPADIDDVVKAIKLMSNEIYDLKNAFSSISQTFKNTVADFNSAGKLIGMINSSYNKLSSLSAKVQEHVSGTNILTVKQLELIKGRAAAEVKNLKNQEKDIANKLLSVDIGSKQHTTLLAMQNELALAFADSNSELETIEAQIQDVIKKEEELNKKLGLTGTAYKLISKILKSYGVDSEIITSIGKKLRDAADAGKTGFGSLFSILGKELPKILEDPAVKFTIGLKAFKSGLSDIKKAFNVFLEFDKVFTETARGLGMSTSQVTKMIKATQLSGDAFSKNVYTAAQIGKSISDVNAQLGTSVIVSNQTLDEFTAMTNQMGLSADEASKIYKLSLLNGSSLKDTNKDIAAGILAVQKRSGIQINEKQVFQEIGKLSAGITAKFQQNVPALAAAVAQAKALGTNLEQVDKIGESLLNFESSIESELKAELITGKQLNLEKARYAALTGDQVTLTQELANQVGSLSEFQGMNVIAQKSLAEAFGMSREELAEMLKQQAVFNKLGDVSNMTAQQKLDRAKELKLSNDDALVQDLQRQASAEQLAATFDSIKVSIAEALNGPFKGLVNVFANLAKNAGLIRYAIGGLAAISLVKTIGGLAVMAVQLGMSATAAIVAASALTLGLAAGAIILGLSAVSGAQEDIEASIKARVPGAAFGGIVEAKPGGTLVNVAEAGSDELLIPLNSPKANTMLGGGGGVTVDDLREFAANIVNGIRNQTQPDIILSVDGDNFGRIAGKQASTSTNTRQYNSYNLA
jgi:hypothetical protein